MSIDELIQLIEASDRSDDPGVRGALLGLSLAKRPRSVALEKLRERQLSAFKEMLMVEAFPQLVNPDPFARPKGEEVAGDIILGHVIQTGYPVGLYFIESGKHLLGVGSAGSGKTTLLEIASEQAIRKGINVLFFDNKRDYIHLARKGAWVFRVSRGEPKFNPLEPPSRVSWQAWAGIISNVFSQATGLVGGMGTENLIYKVLMGLYRQFVPHGVYPCIADLLEKFSSMRVDRLSPAYQWTGRVQNRLMAIEEALGEVLRCSKGYMSEILSHNVILDLTGVKSDMQLFFTESLLTNVLTHRIAAGERHREPRNIIIFDEAQRLIGKRRDISEQGGISPLNIFIEECREFGAGIWCASNEPSLLSDSIKSNAYTRVCFGLSHGRDVEDIALSMGLNKEQKAVIYQLDVGQAIVRFARYPEPFLIKVLPYVYDKSISDEEIDTLMEPVLSGLEWQPRAEPGSIRLREEQAEPGASEKILKYGITMDGLDYLKSVMEQPFLAATARDKFLKISTWAGSQRRADLVKAGLCKEIKIRTGARGKVLKLLQITEEGWSLLEDLKVKIKRLKGKGGFEHQWIQHTIKNWAMAQGWRAEVEGSRLGNKCVDVAIEKSKEAPPIAVEIMLTTQPADEIRNIRADLECGYSEVWVVCKSEKEIKKLKKAVAEIFGEDVAAKVSYRTLASFLD